MKYIFTFLFSLMIYSYAHAQQSSNVTAEYNGQKYAAYQVSYNLPVEETEDVVKNKMKALGYQSQKSKGYLLYRNVKLNDLDASQHLDVLYKVERKSRKEKDQSIITMIAAPVGAIPSEKVKGAKITANIERPARGAEFLGSFNSDIEKSAYNLELERQVNEVAKAEKSLEKLQKEQQKLEKKLQDLQDDLAKNKKDQEIQTEEVARQRKLLEEKKLAAPGSMQP